MNGAFIYRQLNYSTGIIQNIGYTLYVNRKQSLYAGSSKLAKLVAQSKRCKAIQLRLKLLQWQVQLQTLAQAILALLRSLYRRLKAAVALIAYTVSNTMLRQRHIRSIVIGAHQTALFVAVWTHGLLHKIQLQHFLQAFSAEQKL